MDTMRVMSFGQKSRFFIDGPCSSRGMSCFRLCRKEIRTGTVNALFKTQLGSIFFLSLYRTTETGIFWLLYGRVTTLVPCASKAPTLLKVLDLTPLADCAICSPHAGSNHTDLQSATNSHPLSYCGWLVSENKPDMARQSTHTAEHTDFKRRIPWMET